MAATSRGSGYLANAPSSRRSNGHAPCRARHGLGARALIVLPLRSGLRISEVPPPTESHLDFPGGPESTFRGMQTILWCPQCGERVLAPGEYTVGRHHARNERSTCSQCHVELVRHPDLQDNAWAVDDP